MNCLYFFLTIFVCCHISSGWNKRTKETDLQWRRRKRREISLSFKYKWWTIFLFLISLSLSLSLHLVLLSLESVFFFHFFLCSRKRLNDFCTFHMYLMMINLLKCLNNVWMRVCVCVWRWYLSFSILGETLIYISNSSNRPKSDFICLNCCCCRLASQFYNHSIFFSCYLALICIIIIAFS